MADSLIEHNIVALKEARKTTALKFKKITNEEYENVLLNRIANLETKILEQDDYLKDLLKTPAGTGWIFPYEWQLTGKETNLLIALCQFQLCSKERLYSELYSGTISDKDLVAIKVIDVFICKIRKKIPFKIETLWGKGYFIEDSMRNELKNKYFFTVEVLQRPSLKSVGLEDG